MPGKATFIVREDEVKNWIGRPVYSSDNKKIGEIIEIKRDPDNKVTELSIDTGSFLGIGATRYRVTSDQIQEVKPDGLVLTLKESEVKSAPQAGEKQQ
jgi:sporulation protein YlmC with PRC-barrel domain